MSLVEFLLARIAEDEEVAQAATAGPWRYNPRQEWHTDLGSLIRARAGQWTPDGEEFVAAGPKVSPICVAATGPADDPESMVDAEHIARWDPARVLAECEAKRQILRLHELWPVLLEGPPKYETSPASVGEMAMRVSQQMEWLTQQEYRQRFGDEPPTTPILRALALPYADHPDYQQEWRP